MTGIDILAIVIAYLLGAIPFGYLIAKRAQGSDIRESGSGSIGATNVMRSVGRAPGVATLLLDVGKGFAAVLVAKQLSHDQLLTVVLASFAAIAGHVFPVFLQFRGGKGVATGVGVYLAVAPKAVLAVLVIWVIVVAIWRYVSLGSILGTAAFPLCAYVIYRPPLTTALGIIAGATLIVLKHWNNIGRLVAGTERRLDLSRGPKS
jgi:glycerol-3-phosphate acyltransferase PlsY